MNKILNDASIGREESSMLEDVRSRLINVERKINVLLRQDIVLSGAALDSVAGNDEQLFGPRTYAQHGDDIIILNIFKLLQIERPTYLDIGAHDPFNISNTALLYTRGSRGVNVEANPLLIKAFQTQRPEDVNLNVAVADKPGSMSFFIFGDRSGINTLDESRARSLEATSRFKIQRTIDIQAVTIAQIVDQHCGGIFPDFLSLDVEGLDLSILRTIDFQKSKPKLICVEGNTKQERASYTDLLSSNGYHLYFRAAVNLFFVDGQFLPMLQA